MSGKSTIEVLNKVTKTTLDEEIAKYVAYHRYYQRLIAIRIISEGHSIAEAARIIGKSYQIVHRLGENMRNRRIRRFKTIFWWRKTIKINL